MHAFLDESGFGNARRLRMQGDASTRIFERLARDDRNAILMNAPRRPDGPPVRDGKPYSAIAHLAEDVVPYVALSAGLRALRLSAPEILHADLDHGLIVMEDLGEDRIVNENPPVPLEARYACAVDICWLFCTVMTCRRRCRSRRHLEYRLPRYDFGAFLIEAELLLDWYLTAAAAPTPDFARDDFVKLWRKALVPAIAARPTWVLRDYHSPPNLLWPAAA